MLTEPTWGTSSWQVSKILYMIQMDCKKHEFDNLVSLPVN